MYCGSNKTALSSQRQIARALLSLMQEEPYDRITISALCKEAGISRQTFYSLFTSRENVVVFTLQARYRFTPDEEMLTTTRKDACGLRMLCRSYSEYIEANRNFLQLLSRNKIDYLLYDSIFEALSDCGCFLEHTDPLLPRTYGSVHTQICCQLLRRRDQQCGLLLCTRRVHGDSGRAGGDAVYIFYGIFILVFSTQEFST